MKPVLKVFIAEHCSTCDEACAIATRIAQDYPEVIVEVIDIGAPQSIVPETVFAIPTFMLNNRIVSLGTPYLKDIVKLVEEAIALIG
jgi:thiol-disulfide isomerase/thioredoxin